MKFIRIVFSFSLLVLGVAAATAYVRLANLNGLFVVQFDSFRQISFLGSSAHVYGIILLALAFLAANYFLAESLFSKDRFLATLISLTGVFLAILLFAAVFGILANI